MRPTTHQNSILCLLLTNVFSLSCLPVKRFQDSLLDSAENSPENKAATSLNTSKDQMPAARSCSDEEKNMIFTGNTPLDMPPCSLTFEGPEQVLSRSIQFVGSKVSGAVLDCKGGSIKPSTKGYSVAIRSEFIASSWKTPQYLTIRNCVIYGSLRAFGLGTNGEAKEVHDSSREPDHTARAQASAPSKLQIIGNRFVADEMTPLYLSPGVHDVLVESNTFTGESRSVSIYLDAESTQNRILRNHFQIQGPREVIALDGSSFNTISGNSFLGLNFGGVFVYRNCGQGGTVRHQEPTHNAMINNYFEYNTESNQNPKPAIHLGSRHGNRKYCEDDSGFPWGSSVSNDDFADSSLVVDNQIKDLDPRKVIVNQGVNNTVFQNVSVAVASPSKSGCAYAEGGKSGLVFIKDSQVSTVNNKPMTCKDGTLIGN